MRVLRTGHTYPQEVFPVLISVRGCLDSRAIVRTKRIEPATFRKCQLVTYKLLTHGTTIFLLLWGHLQGHVNILYYHLIFTVSEVTPHDIQATNKHSALDTNPCTVPVIQAVFSFHNIR